MVRFMERLFRYLGEGIRWIRHQDADWRVDLVVVTLVNLAVFLAFVLALGDYISVSEYGWMTSIPGTIVGFALAAALTNGTRRLWRKVRR